MRACFERGERVFHTRLLFDKMSNKRERHAVKTRLECKTQTYEVPRAPKIIQTHPRIGIVSMHLHAATVYV